MQMDGTGVGRRDAAQILGTRFCVAMNDRRAYTEASFTNYEELTCFGSSQKAGFQ